MKGVNGMFLAGSGAVLALLAFLSIRGAGAGTNPPEGTAAVPAPPGLHPETIYVPEQVGQAHTGDLDALGRPVRMECTACHGRREEAAVAPLASEIDSVHTGMAFTHGSLTCFSCHDPDTDYSQLRLADGTNIGYRDVMTLCSQCHGPQRTDYDHGAHGGMVGYWDRTRGPRDRNACIVCHDPHAPGFPQMQPRFKPIDRFLTPETQETAHEH